MRRTTNESGVPTSKPHLAHIDALRGFAVLMVATAHLSLAMPELPNPVRRFGILGFYGVQLFFMMSAFTLMMSWRSEEKRYGSASTPGFFIRRFFRIAPAYYLAAAFYFLFSPPPDGFSLGQLLANLGFVNGWHPTLMTTVKGAWQVVPGGWSIGVEFSFYCLFPLIAAAVTSLWRAVAGFLLAVTIGLTVNLLLVGSLFAQFGRTAGEQFLYNWLPNQLFVFFVGLILFYLIGDRSARSIKVVQTLRPRRHAIASISVLLFCAASFINRGRFLGAFPLLQEDLYIALPLALFVCALASGPTFLVNRVTELIGTVSFSAYLVHFAVIAVLAKVMARAFAATGISSVAWFLACWVIMVFILTSLSLCSYFAIELPMNNFARRLAKAVSQRKPGIQLAG
jgi:peptidoglycan/LPS O-acetylase OafA/YrhL